MLVLCFSSINLSNSDIIEKNRGGNIIMQKNEKRIVIVDCCEVRFSKIIDDWSGVPIVGEETSLSIFPGQRWDAHVENIFPAKSAANPFELDVIFATSWDENLFNCLCNCIGDENGWFESEDACIGLLSE